MTSQAGKQIITIHILPNISRSKDNKAMKFGKLIEYNVRNTFFKKYAENETGRLVPDLFYSLKKIYISSKQVVDTLVIIHFGRPSLGPAIKTN